MCYISQLAFHTEVHINLRRVPAGLHHLPDLHPETQDPAGGAGAAVRVLRGAAASQAARYERLQFHHVELVSHRRVLALAATVFRPRPRP